MPHVDPSVEALFARTTLGIKPGLKIVSSLLEALGNPHRRLAVVHVAGTNGKGSVCAMTESVLRASGFKTGLYTSPHLIDFSERFRINGETIPEEELHRYMRLLETTAELVERETGERPATFFEISTAIAFQYFADQQVDIAVIETGMGGRWDATNVVVPLLSVITRIDVDHTDYLGDTLEKIATEKAGIIKPGRPVVCAPQVDTVMEVLCHEDEPIIRSDESVSVVKIGEPQRLKIETASRSLPPVNLPLLGECQRENCAVAVAALETLADMLEFEPQFKKGLESARWEARFQTLCISPLVILDGAHNPSGARALAKTLRELHPGRRIGFVFGFLGDKDSAGFLREIKPLAAKAWAVPIDAPRGTTAEHSAAQARFVGIDAVPAAVGDAWRMALEWAAAGPNRIICIAGSLYLKQMLRDAGLV